MMSYQTYTQKERAIQVRIHTQQTMPALWLLLTQVCVGVLARVESTLKTIISPNHSRQA
jgi:hypothetical protein